MNKKYGIVLSLLVIAILILGVAIYLKNNQRMEAINTGEGIPINRELSGEIHISGDNSGENIFSGEKVLGAKDSGEVSSTDVKESTEIKKEDKKETTTTQNLTSNSPYYVKINNLQNVVTVYTKDAEGNYTVPYKAMVCSTGIDTPVAGKKHKVTSYRKRWNALQGNVYGQYATQIVGNILFHSVPYTAKKTDALEYWEYDKLGSAASLGCIRLTVQDAKWVYDNIVAGTIVEFYEDANPGPLGKPTAQKISDNEKCRNWDPTDMEQGNPWREKVIEETLNEIPNSGSAEESGNTIIFQNSGELN